MPNIIVTSPGELEALVRKVVRDEVTQLRPVEDDVIDLEQCAALLKVCPRTVITYVKKQGLPGKRLGGHMWRFRRSAVLAWAEGRK